MTKDSLIDKLDGFIKKYYRNELLKGVLYTLIIGLGYFLMVAILEYFGKFSSGVRWFMFYSLLFVLVATALRFIVYPISKLLKIGKTIDHHQAAQIVGNHFGDVKDKLLNTLQLQENAISAGSSGSLLVASIEQKTSELRPVPFQKAVDFSENKSYLLYLIPILLLFGGLMLFKPDVLTQSTERIVNYNSKAPAPFSFHIQNANLSVVEGEEIEIEVKTKGTEIPGSVYLHTSKGSFKMKKKAKNKFVYSLRPQKDTKIYFSGNGVESDNKTIRVLPKPMVQNFQIKLSYPSYTGKKNETIENVGDLSVPEGTMASWEIITKSTDKIHLTFGDTNQVFSSELNESYSFSKDLRRSLYYSLKTENEYIKSKDSVLYFINVKADEHPKISINSERDSARPRLIYFDGEIVDDYGFSGLSFTYVIKETGKRKSMPVGFSKDRSTDKFLFMWDIRELGLKPGETVKYFFTVTDNDGVNGPKSVSSQSNSYQAPTLEELEAQNDENANELSKSLQNSMKEANKLKEEMKKMENELGNSKSMDWQQKQNLSELLKRQMQLQNDVEKMQEKFKENNEFKDEFKELDPELLEKQKMLEKLMEELLTPEMKELMEELQKMMDQLNKEQIQEKLEEMTLDNEQMEKEMDRALEQYKEMLFQEKLNDAIDELEKLAEKQEELGEKTQNKEISEEESKKEQDKLDKEFEKAKEKMEELKEKNEELQNKHDLSEPEKSMENAEQEMNDSQESLQNGKQKQAGQKQKSAAQEMKKAAAQMKQMQQQEQEQRAGEDMNAIRQILENLVQLSFDQEGLMDELNDLSRNDPRYFEVGREQKKLEDNAQIVKDSLFALSKRQPMLSSTVNREISDITYFMEKAIEEIQERKSANAKSHQQYVMTATNNLALLLDEALQSMQSQMQSQSQSKSQNPGSGSCNKPGGNGAPKPGQSLDQLKKQMEDALKQMQNAQKGNNPGGQKPGQKPGGQNPGGMGMPGGMGSEQFAKMAAQQAMMREQLKRMRQMLNEDGSGAGNGLNDIIKDVEELEKELVNKQFNHETIKRQQDIYSRLLEHEKAERERDWDEKRESKEGKNKENSNPDRFLEYKKRKEKELELLKTISPDLNIYYKNKVNSYFNGVQ